MATTLSGKISLSTTLNYIKALGSQPISARFTPSEVWDITSGVTIDKADLLFFESNTLTTGTNKDYDLAGVLEDVFGDVLTMVRVKAIFIKFTSAVGGAHIDVGGAAANPFLGWFKDVSDKIQVRNGGFLAMIAPDATAWAVTAGSADTLRVAHDASDAAAITYEILIIGASA